jgi:hypothetical protein
LQTDSPTAYQSARQIAVGTPLGIEHLTPWKTGQSGNPKGAIKAGADVARLARTYTAEAVNTLAAIMQNKEEPPSARVSAANSILDRGWGKPLQSISTPDGNSPITLHLLAAQLVSQQDRATDMVSPTIAHEPEPNGRAFDLNAPPPNE